MGLWIAGDHFVTSWVAAAALLRPSDSFSNASRSLPTASMTGSPELMVVATAGAASVAGATALAAVVATAAVLAGEDEAGTTALGAFEEQEAAVTRVKATAASTAAGRRRREVVTGTVSALTKHD